MRCYEARGGHVSNPSNRPGVGANWTTYWIEYPCCSLLPSSLSAKATPSSSSSSSVAPMPPISSGGACCYTMSGAYLSWHCAQKTEAQCQALTASHPYSLKGWFANTTCGTTGMKMMPCCSLSYWAQNLGGCGGSSSSSSN